MQYICNSCGIRVGTVVPIEAVYRLGTCSECGEFIPVTNRKNFCPRDTELVDTWNGANRSSRNSFLKGKG